jgi:calcineurin-like phosphoesterase family protein
VGRPYQSVEEMNDDIVRRFLAKTQDATEVYILGDIVGSRIALPLADASREVMTRLGIRQRPFHLVLGNHDILSDEEYLGMGFTSVNKIEHIILDGMKVMLTHDPCMVQPPDTLAICGHIHTLFSENWQPARNTFTINVGVEARGYEPVSEMEILEIVKRSDYKR